jgi:hypothetical protein
MSFVIELLNDTLWFLALAFVMLLWADYLNTLTHGRAAEHLKRHPSHQYISGTILGGLPGCFGSFINVSLYTHRLYSFGALLAGMIAATGDEGFFMLALFPQKALMLMISLAILGFSVGWIFDKLFPEFEKSSPLFHELPMHGEDHGHTHHHENKSGLSVSAQSLRWILSAVMLAVFAALVLGWIHHPEFVGHTETESDHHERGETWFTAFALISSLWIFLKTSDHYLEEHIWNHIIRHHLPKFALWTAGTLLLLKVGGHFVGLDSWLSQNPWQTLVFALLIGLLPVSGPHLTFAILFSQGTIPFSILIANSIVQEGHGILPLLPYPKRDAIVIKVVKLALGLLIGGLLLAYNF